MSDRLRIDRNDRTWPWREASRIVTAGGLNWHVQVLGDGPVLLLIHGTGASSHSWYRVIGLLRPHFTLVAPDLPGHAFTENPGTAALTLPAMAAAVAQLMSHMDMKPAMVVGHSAGAAIGLRAVIDGGLSPRAVISINGAMLPFGGAAEGLFAPLARLMVAQPWVPRLLAWRAGHGGTVARLLADTGSNLPDEDVALYSRLFQNPDHVAATLAMMAKWDLKPLVRDLGRVAAEVVLVAGDNDKAIAPAQADEVALQLPRAEVVHLPGLGHLAHEERPDIIARLILRVGVQQRLLDVVDGHVD